MSSSQRRVSVGASQTVSRRVPASSSRHSSASSKSSKLPSASDIMKAKSDPKSKVEVDPYPGIDAILHKARKMRPFKSSDTEQRTAALAQLLNVNIPHPDYITRMEREHAALVSKWHADNDFLPVDKRQPFPYTRAREVRHLPEFKNASKSVPEWLKRMNEEQETYDALPQDVKDRAQSLVDSEIKQLRNDFKLEKFNPYDQEWKAVNVRGYNSGKAYRAYRLFSQDQHDLLASYSANPTPESKKILLQHIQDHGQLILSPPKPDAPAPKSAPKSAPKPTSQPPSRVHVGSVMDSVV